MRNPRAGFWRFLITAGYLVPLCSRAIAAPLGDVPAELSPEQESLGRTLLQGMWDARERVRSGVFHAVYITQRDDPKQARTEEFFVCFDFTADRLRFDRREGSRFTQYSRTPSESLLHVEGSNVICRYDPNWNILVRDARPFDSRLIGLQSLAEFDFRRSYEALRKKLESHTFSEVEREANGIFRLSWDGPGKPMLARLTILVDKTKQFSPVRTELRRKSLLQKTANSPRGSVEWIEQASETQWTEAGVWVPIKWTTREPKLKKTYEMKLEWESVNAPLADSLFSPEGFGARRGTAVSNMRLGKPIVESIIGWPPNPGPTADASSWRRWAAAVSVIAAILIAMAIFSRRLWKSRNARC